MGWAQGKPVRLSLGANGGTDGDRESLVNVEQTILELGVL